MNRAAVVARLRALWAADPAFAGVTIITSPQNDVPRESVMVGATVTGAMSVRRTGTPRPWDDSFTVSVVIESQVPGASLAQCEARIEALTEAAITAVLAAPTLGVPAIPDLVGLDMGAQPVEITTEFGVLPQAPGFAGIARFSLPFRSQHC